MKWDFLNITIYNSVWNWDRNIANCWFKRIPKMLKPDMRIQP